MKAEHVYGMYKREKTYLVLKIKFLVLHKSSNTAIHKGTQVLFKHINTARALW